MDWLMVIHTGARECTPPCTSKSCALCVELYVCGVDVKSHVRQLPNKKFIRISTVIRFRKFLTIDVPKPKDRHSQFHTTYRQPCNRWNDKRWSLVLLTITIINNSQSSANASIFHEYFFKCSNNNNNNTYKTAQMKQAGKHASITTVANRAASFIHARPMQAVCFKCPRVVCDSGHTTQQRRGGGSQASRWKYWFSSMWWRISGLSLIRWSLAVGVEDKKK